MWELLFEENPYIYKNIGKLFFERDFEGSGYSGLVGFNILPRVMSGLRPVIPFQNDRQLCKLWTQKFIHSKFTNESIVECLFKMKDLMESCWQPTPEKRPSFASVIKILNDIRNTLRLNKQCV